MKNVDSLVNTMLASENPDEVSWGKQIVAANRFNFGEYDDLEKTVSSETLYTALNERKGIFRLPHPNSLFYCDDFLFIHVIDCGGGIIEARAAIVGEQMDGFYLYPVYLKIAYGKNEVSSVPFMGGKKRSRKKTQQDLDWLYLVLSRFFIIINDYSNKVGIETLKDRHLTLAEIAALTGNPLDVVEKRAEEEHWARTFDAEYKQ